MIRPAFTFAAVCCLALLPEFNSPATAAPSTQPIIQGAFQGGGALLGQAPPIAPERPAPSPAAAAALKLRWTCRLSADDPAGLESSPVIVGQTVYVADNRASLHAIDLVTGKPRWTHKTEDGFVATPLVMNDRIYIGDQGGTLHCVSADTGRKIWTADIESGTHSSANALGNRILLGTDAAQIFCFDAAGGKPLWKLSAGDRVNAAPSIGLGLAFFSGCDANLRAIDVLKGREKFAFELGALAPGSAVLLEDRAVVGTDQGRVVCVQLPQPRELWVYEQIENNAMVYATPAIADGIVVVGARDRQVHAIDLQTGKRKWVFQTRGEVDAPALISAGRVYVGSKDRRLYVLDLKTGEKLWDFATARPIDGGGAIGGWALVVGDTGGNVYCLEP